MAEAKPKISILICHMPHRKMLLERLLACFSVQDCTDIEILIYESPLSVGSKRNWLLDHAKGDYVAFVDDDDIVSESYISLVMEGINKGVDCCSLMGEITFDGKNPELFEHSIKYKEYRTTTNKIKYERFPNHLNAIKASIAKQFRFPEKNHGEDTDWATQIFKSGLIKTEHYIPEILYYYDWKSKK